MTGIGLAKSGQNGDNETETSTTTTTMTVTTTKGNIVNPDDYVDLSKLQAWDNNWDGRDGQDNSGVGSRYVILVRHGQYYSKEKEDKKRVLTVKGHNQALLLAKRLKQMQLKQPMELVSSTLIRAIQTAEYVSEAHDDLEFVRDVDLREGRPYQVMPLSSSNPKPYLREQVARDGERIDRAFERYIHRPSKDDKSKYVVLVCHANVIRYFVCKALQLPKEAWLRMSLPHCGVTVLRLKPNGRVSLRCLGDSGFLPANMVTYQ